MQPCLSPNRSYKLNFSPPGRFRFLGRGFGPRSPSRPWRIVLRATRRWRCTERRSAADSTSNIPPLTRHAAPNPPPPALHCIERSIGGSQERGWLLFLLWDSPLDVFSRIRSQRAHSRPPAREKSHHKTAPHRRPTPPALDTSRPSTFWPRQLC